MDCFRKVLGSFNKTFGLSSNKLLKCVLLNTAVDLFSYMNAPSDLDIQLQSDYWDMEQLDHLYYSTLYALPHCSVIGMSTTERITDKDYEPDLQQTCEGDAEHENPNVFLGILPNFDEALPNSEENSTLAYMPPDENESIWSLDENDCIWSQFPMAQFYFLMPVYFGTCANAVTDNIETENVVLLSYPGFQTNLAPDPLKTPDWCGTETSTFNYEDGIEPISILWDSYDLHSSWCEMGNTCADEIRNLLNEFCSSEDLFMEPKPCEKENISSTPSSKKLKTRTQMIYV